MNAGMNKRGFTLIELLVVIGIIGLLASVILGGLQVARIKAKNAAMSQNFHVLKVNIEYHFNEYGAYTTMCDVGSVVLNNLIGIAYSYGGGTPEAPVALPGWNAGSYYSCYVNTSNEGIDIDYVVGIKLSDTSYMCIDSTGGQIQERQGTDNCFYNP